jgi:DNA-binding NtrC family response regulator
MSTVAFVGSVPEPVREVLRSAGHDVVDDSKADIVIAQVQGDWPSFSQGSVVIALADSMSEVSAAYHAGAQAVAPPDPEVVKILVQRAAEQKSVRSLAHLEREAILSAIKASAGSTARAAAMLDISVRKVQYKLHEYGVPLSRKSPKPSSQL